MRLTLIFFIAIAFIAAGYTIYTPYSVRESAEVIAGNAPFCIQVAASGGYREVSGNLDLTWLRMRGQGPLNHAILVVGKSANQKLYHWSYFKNSFEEGGYGAPPIFCETRQNYLSTIGDKMQKDEQTLAFRYAGYKFVMPRGYRPSFNLPSSGGHQILILSASAPEFKPVATSRSPIIITFGSSGFRRGGGTRAGEGTSIQSLGVQYGLKAERILPIQGEPRIQYFTADEDGPVNTRITCFESMVGQCNHIFYDGRFFYSIHQMPSDLKNWKMIQENLKSVFKSFLIESNA